MPKNKVTVRARDDRRSMFVNIIYYISRFQHGKVQILQYREGPRALLGWEGGKGGREGRQERVSIAQKGEATHVKGMFLAGYGDVAFG